MSDIIDQPENYFKQLIPKRDELLLELEAQAELENIPIIGPVVGELLFILAYAAKARRILELGTATGYSAIYLAKACEVFNGRVVTLLLLLLLMSFLCVFVAWFVLSFCVLFLLFSSLFCCFSCIVFVFCFVLCVFI